MKDSHPLKHSSKIDYNGLEQRIVDIELVTPPGSVAADDFLYHLQNCHGDVIQVCDYEIDKYRKANQ
jgi:hypothetical protein